MDSKYIIQWKSRVNGRAGRGTKIFDKEQAERLALELNSEYPQILHEAIPAPDLGAEQPEESSVAAPAPLLSPA